MGLKKPTLSEDVMAFAEGDKKPETIPHESKPQKTAQKTKEKIGSGFVPEGDVRLTANIRSDLHMKLKMRSVQDRTTIGEILEELIEKHL